jgi:hypothetical protein
MPLKFYTRMRVVGGFTGEDLTPALKAQWVIFRHNIVYIHDYLVAKYLQDHLRKQDYRRIKIDYPDVAFDNREDPEGHLYRTATGVPPVIILQRIAR